MFRLAPELRRVIFLVLLSFSLFAAEKTPLRFNAVSSGWPPYAYYGSDNRALGILVDALPLFLQEANINIEISNFPLLRAEKGMEDGAIDVMVRSKSWTKNPDDYYWSDPIITNRDIILSLKNSPIEFSQISDLSGKKIGTIHGFKYPTLESLFRDKKLERIDALNTENSLQMLTHNHVEGIVISEAVAKWMIRNDKSLQNKFHFSQNAIDQNTIEYRFRKDEKLLPIIQKLHQGLTKSKKNKSFEKLINSYL